MSACAFVALTPRGLALARRLSPVVPGASIHATVAAGQSDVAIERVAPHLRALFEEGTTIIGLCAAGILIRALAPGLNDKATEPPVLALADDGSAVIPLLGGHRGANRLARQLADRLGIAAALTTASELIFGGALDDPPAGYGLAPGSDAKTVGAALLRGEPVDLVVEAGQADWLLGLVQHSVPGARHRIVLTDRALVPTANMVVIHPAVLAIGVGCSRGAPAGELIALIDATLQEAGLNRAAIAGLFSLDLKLDEPAMHAAATHFGVPFRVFDHAQLAAEQHHLHTPSDEVERAVGLKGVAEAAALAAAGDGGALIVPKRRSANATVAIARALAPIDPTSLGRTRGRLAVIGIGPGAAAWRTPEATALLAGSDDLIGYSLYLDLLGPIVAGKERHDFALGEETARADAALALASTGRRVALISSGDAGVYGMASLALERLEAKRDACKGVELVVAPGLSSVLAAAARAGAPLGHDFCTISLSDRLTPLAMIEQRLDGALAGDFVIALFNPAAATRREPLERALAAIQAKRAPATPVILARAVGRAEESIEVMTLDALEPERIDMMSLVIIGNSESRIVDHEGRRFMLTPRGYRATP
ncbi:MAG: precorrin-3B C(17)-methyltransferase [Alphaproteobacteria bacterium]|nr:precorrin-3B C(17)-methyltransferase [Alphaproteobacteria bacterium]